MWQAGYFASQRTCACEQVCGGAPGSTRRYFESSNTKRRSRVIRTDGRSMREGLRASAARVALPDVHFEARSASGVALGDRVSRC